MKFKTSLLTILLCISFITKGAVVDTAFVYSASMNKKIETIVIFPSDNNTSKPVVYLLHGHGGNAKHWISYKPELKEIADQNNWIFVCPDGKDSWYWDSPKDTTYKYETFIIKELISYIDNKYPTIKKRTGRAITGLSMGGHGAIWLAFRHKDIFGAVGSTSGGLDIRPFPHNWCAKLLGEEYANKDLWNQYTAINQIDRLKNKELAIIIDCGYDDFFYEVNNNFHNKLLSYKIDHDFIVRPGIHNWDYWRNSIEYQFLFFYKYFAKENKCN